MEIILGHLCCPLEILEQPVCVTCVVRSRLMENQFASPIDGELVCVTGDVRSRLMKNQFNVRFRLMENQFASPVTSAPDWWRSSFPHVCCALQIGGEPVCDTCDVRSRLIENQFASPVLCAPD
ncbi:hypothetical protein RRG08_033178 [Elysia crispata]|uniref:Uncharacterized protein n=1 Tax=Elysia crispata TaxID=231223 RepID=A0AAE1BAI1_9GAST|nr:hypothetical protein RRG08_033178 [Elysia crispata]